MPGKICSVAVCKSNSHLAEKNGEKIRFLNFPKDNQLRKEWVRRCHRKDKFDPKNKRICSKHFSPDCYEDALKAKLMNELPRKLKADCVPSLYLLPEKLSTELPQTSRTERALIKKQKELVKDLLTTSSIEEKQIEATVADLPSSSKETPYEILLRNYHAAIKENEDLKKKLVDNEALLKEKNLELQHIINNYEGRIDSKVQELFCDFLTPNQINIILKKKTKARWTTEEISKAFTIRYFSKRCYIYLRQTLKYPLPGISTLQRWAGNINLRRGLLKDVLNVMYIAGKSKDNFKRIVVLSFDEVKICSTYEYDQKEDEVVGPHAYMQVIMARGLFDNWKQPVFIAFDTKVTKSLLENVITELHKINYNVVACVSDCGGSNVGLWGTLDINVDKTYCLHPVTQQKIYFFADVPHILELTRNWLLDTGFILEGGIIINKQPLHKLIEITNSEISSCHKLTPLHLTCERAQRQNVPLAAQLLSHTTATALRRYLPGANKELARNVADFIELVNSWFDILNSYTPAASILAKQPYGKNLEAQNEALDKAKRTFSKMICTSKKSLQTFQKGLIISTSSLQGLYRDLAEEYKIAYILTHRLNQDCLENFFSQLRTKGGLHDHPAPLNALYRIRMILLGKNPGMVQAHSNILESPEAERDEYVLASALEKADIKGQWQEADNLDPESQEEDNLSICSSSSTSSSLSNFPKLEGIAEKDGLVYIAGYLAKKHQKEYPHLGNYTYKDSDINLRSPAAPSWVQNLSFGGLTQPSEEWQKNVQDMEKYFKIFHKENARNGNKIVQRTANFISRKVEGIPKPLIKSFSRQRLFMRIKFLNTQTRLGKRKSESDAHRKSAKKIKKTVN